MFAEHRAQALLDERAMGVECADDVRVGRVHPEHAAGVTPGGGEAGEAGAHREPPRSLDLPGAVWLSRDESHDGSRNDVLERNHGRPQCILRRR